MPEKHNLVAPNGADENSPENPPNPTATDSPESDQTVGMRHELLLMALGVAVTWGVLAIPCNMIAGSTGLWGLSYSAILCGITSISATYLCHIRSRKGPDAVSMAFVLGSCLRLPVILISAILIQKMNSEFVLRTFGVWLIITYVVTFGLDVFLIARWLTRNQRRSQA